jgi:phosphate transport system substrate-binding protein
MRVIRRGRLGGLLALAGATLVAGCGGGTPAEPPPAAASPPVHSIVLHATGGDYAAPIYEELSSVLESHGITLNYQLDGPSKLTHGSGPDAVQLLASASGQSLGATPLFDGTDYVPVGFGGVAVTYDLSGVHGLRLTGAALADIMSGRVARWNAREIARSNPGLKLPATPITVVRMSGPSFLTGLLSGYLSDSSRRWRRSIGTGDAVNWPGGTGVASEADMLQIVRQTPGAIGYVSQSTALQNGTTVARLGNPSGQYIAPTLSAISSAGAQSHPRGQLSLGTIDARVRGAYPIVSEAYVMTFSDPCSAGASAVQTDAIQRVLQYLVGHSGQALVRSFSFAPLPRRLAASATAAVRSLRCGGQPL